MNLIVKIVAVIFRHVIKLITCAAETTDTLQFSPDVGSLDLTTNPGLSTASRRLYFQCLFQEPVVIGATDAHFYNGPHSSKKFCSCCLLSLCLIMLSGFSHSSFWFALRNVTSADLDWPSEGFCTLGRFSIGLRCLFLRDALLDYASLPKTHTFGSEIVFLELNSFFFLAAFHCLSVINCSPKVGFAGYFFLLSLLHHFPLMDT